MTIRITTVDPTTLGRRHSTGDAYFDQRDLSFWVCVRDGKPGTFDHTIGSAGITDAIAAAVAAVIDGAPGALDTLNELAAAMADDASFATTVTNALAAKAAKSKTINTRTDDYVLALVDADAVVEMNKGSANTLTVPANATVAFPVGTQIRVVQLGAGLTTIVAAGGVTINSVSGTLDLGAQYGQGLLIKRATNAWDLSLSGAAPSGPSGGLPIANNTGPPSTETETPDPISGADTAEWVKFPSDATVMAWGLEGDDFPRVVFGADPSDFGVIMCGDGVSDPLGGATLFVQTSAQRGTLFQLFGGSSSVGALLGSLAWTGGSGDPNGQHGGKVGDTYVGTGPTGVLFSRWTCTTQGNAGTAVWTCTMMHRATDSPLNDITPPNAGIVCVVLSSGEIWISTGITNADWRSATGETDLVFGAPGTGPVLLDSTDGHTYRLGTTNGVVTATLVS